MDPQIHADVPFFVSTWQPGYKKENCKGINYLNRGEIKLSCCLGPTGALQSVHSVPMTGNEKQDSHDIERKSWEDVEGSQEIAYKVTRTSF
jgi:hypothetical protein